MVCSCPDTSRSTHPCGNNTDVNPIMQKIKKDTHEGTCVSQSVGIGEGTCVGKCIGI
jgi:hypothetical protein